MKVTRQAAARTKLRKDSAMATSNRKSDTKKTDLVSSISKQKLKKTAPSRSSKRQANKRRSDMKRPISTPDSRDKSESSVKEDQVHVYDFDQSDEDELKLVLFPDDENTENKVKEGEKYTNIRKRKATGSLDVEKKAKVQKRALKSKDVNVIKVDTKLNKKRTAKKSQQNERASILTNKSANNKVIKVPTKPSLKGLKQHQIAPTQSDKDLFVTPILRPRRRKPSPENTSAATSTPSPMVLDVAKKVKSTPVLDQHEQHLIMPSPMLSPVEKLSPINFSPKKHKQFESVKEAISPDYESPKPAERTYSGRGSIGRFPASPALIKEKKKSSKTRSKPTKSDKDRRQSTRFDDWALRFSLELEEAESYELSVED